MIDSIRGYLLTEPGGDQVGQWCWVAFNAGPSYLFSTIVEQGHTVLAVGAGGGVVWVFCL